MPDLMTSSRNQYITNPRIECKMRRVAPLSWLHGQVHVGELIMGWLTTPLQGRRRHVSGMVRLDDNYRMIGLFNVFDICRCLQFHTVLNYCGLPQIHANSVNTLCAKRNLNTFVMGDDQQLTVTHKFVQITGLLRQSSSCCFRCSACSELTL